MKIKASVEIDIPEKYEVELLKIIHFDPSKDQFHSYSVEDEYMDEVVDFLDAYIPSPKAKEIGKWVCNIDMNKYSNFGGE